MIKRDFKFVVELATEFFTQEYIVQRMSLIESKDISGWEIWLQVEFAMFLEQHIAVGEWIREFQYSMDMRSSKKQKYMAIDFLVRKRGAKLDQYIAIEIKQNKSAASCINGMMKDACKISLVKGSEDDIRTMWSLGIHQALPQEDLENLVNSYADEYEVQLGPNCIKTKPIENTNFAFTVF
ncbi:hypothetical protein [Colwellia sp. TT2012]|uniref:hypothetical protein n=1 Tax=Colwellia sp. TT2012 TaxID=1720342 RepID=UPI00070953D0|nr:hypothetical protein [Colwellia sp. TT2012]